MMIIHHLRLVIAAKNIYYPLTLDLLPLPAAMRRRGDSFCALVRVLACPPKLARIFRMPTILRWDGLRAVIYPDDHRPAHVHIIGAGGEAVFVLNCPEGPPQLRGSMGFSSKALGRIAAMLAASLAHLCAIWSEIHGSF